MVDCNLVVLQIFNGFLLLGIFVKGGLRDRLTVGVSTVVVSFETFRFGVLA